jgi:hypothetical protein
MTKLQKLSPDEQNELNGRLIDVAQNGITKEVQRLLADGANVYGNDDWVLRWAAKDGHTEAVKILLEAGADVRALDDYPLRYAALHGHTEIVKVLLAAGANVHAHGDGALFMAACRGHTETLRVLSNHIFAPDSWRGKSRTEIEAYATALHDKIKVDIFWPERLHMTATILADCAIDCWHQVRPPPPKLRISPLPAQPRPL